MEILKSCPFEEPVGKYEIENDKPIVTKEEWFCGLSTEEKAEWLTEFGIRFIPCELTVPSQKIKTYKNNILEWLKQPHKE